MNKNVLKFMVFIMLLNIITPLFNKNEAFAARDISSTNVTDLTVSPSKIEDGGKTTVLVLNDKKICEIASLRQTSLFEMAEYIGISEPQKLIQLFINHDRKVRRQ